jgi:hypothetical protein
MQAIVVSQCPMVHWGSRWMCSAPASLGGGVGDGLLGSSHLQSEVDITLLRSLIQSPLKSPSLTQEKRILVTPSGHPNNPGH